MFSLGAENVSCYLHAYIPTVLSTTSAVWAAVHDRELAGFVSLIVVNVKPTHWLLINPLWVGAHTKVQTKYLPAH